MNALLMDNLQGIRQIKAFAGRSTRTAGLRNGRTICAKAPWW